MDLPGNFKKYNWSGLENRKSALHHFALTVDIKNHEKLKTRLTESGVVFDVADHRWTGWRGIYIQDPEENIVELVSYDSSIDEGTSGAYDFKKLHGSSTGEEFK
jgi:hypothetical protein